MSALNDEAKTKVNTKRSQFVFNGIGSGPLLLHVIIKTTYMVNKGTTIRLRQQLNRLDGKMIELKDDIIAFNAYVNVSLDILQNNDIMTSLFQGHEAAIFRLDQTSSE
jgi:hypothetical protein